MRLRLPAFFASALLCLDAASAHAINVSLFQYPTRLDRFEDGQQFEITGLLENFEEASVSSFSLSLRGFDANGNGLLDDGLTIRESGAPDFVFANSFTEDYGPPYRIIVDGGIDNDLASTELRGGPASGGQPAEELHVAIFEGATTTPTSGNGRSDRGSAGFFIQDGGAHFSITFIAATSGLSEDRTISLFVDATAFDENGNPIAITTSPFDIRLVAVPEPGSLLFLGLGLVALSVRPIRKPRISAMR